MTDHKLSLLEKFKLATAVVAVSIAIIGPAIIAALLLKPYDDIRFIGGDYKVEPASVETGGNFVTLSGVEFCNDGVATHVERFMENELGKIELAKLAFNAPSEPVCLEARSVVEVPPEVPPGTWRFVQQVSYKPNITIRTITVTQYSEWFEVTEEDSK